MDGLSKLLRTLAVGFTATVAGVLLLGGGQAMAGTVTITDNSHVLTQSDVSTVTNAASQLDKDPVRIYTTTNLANDTAAFDQHYAAKLATENPATIIIGINTQSKHVTIQAGTGSHLNGSDGSQAVAAFTGGMRASHSYANALVASLQSLHSSLLSHHVTTGNGTTRHIITTHKKASGISAIFVIIGVVIVLIIVIAILRAIFRAIFGGSRGGPVGPAYGPGPGYGPPPGYGGGYGGGYGPGYGGGMSPGAAAGLGAVGGGLLGYELGRMEGERESHHEQVYYEQQGGYNQGGYSGDGYDNQGGGFSSDGDWGGGGGDSGGGGGGDW